MWRAYGYDPASAGTTLGADVYDVVGNLYYVQIVLDDDGRVASVNQLVDDREQLAYILEVESRGGLIQNVECATSVVLRQLGCKFYALTLTARERCAGLTQRKVAQAYILNSLEALVYGWYVGEEIDCESDDDNCYELQFNYDEIATIASALANMPSIYEKAINDDSYDPREREAFRCMSQKVLDLKNKMEAAFKNEH